MESAQKNLLNKISGAQFAFIECCLFLDTHPYDREALAKSEAYRIELENLVNQYEKTYGPLTLTADFGNDGYDWINNPWPWEKEAN